MCAATAGQRGRKVLLLDHADKPGKKILISGGGRCNFTNLDIRPERFLSQNPHFAKSALARYTQHNFLELVERHNIAWHEKTLGQLFCDESAKQIVEMLLDECRKGDVKIQLNENITNVSHDNHYIVETEAGTYSSQSLVIATGGPSIPKMGATGFAYDLARQLKLKVVEPRPALVPFTLGQDEILFKELSGVATKTITSHQKTSFKEASLFTHKGLSGPAILQISSYWKHGDAIGVNFLPGCATGWLIALKNESPNQTIGKALNEHLPDRLAETLLRKLNADTSSKLSTFKNNTLTEIEAKLENWQFHPNGTEGFAKAEVAIGGISTAELSSKTMEAKKQPGLFCIGEAVDVTGWLGGYNFQWAWSSGFVAGEAV